MSLKIKRTDYGDVTVLELEGRINLGDGSVIFRSTVRDLLKSGRLKLVIAYAGVRFQDSSGNGEIVSAYTTARNAGGDLVLADLSQSVRDVLQLSRLLSVFKIFETIPDAVTYFAK